MAFDVLFCVQCDFTDANFMPELANKLKPFGVYVFNDPCEQFCYFITNKKSPTINDYLDAQRKYFLEEDLRKVISLFLFRRRYWGRE
jgi:hypothetical protein